MLAYELFLMNKNTDRNLDARHLRPIKKFFVAKSRIRIDEKTPEDYGVDISPRLEILETTEPAARAAGIKVSDVEELVSKLKEEAGVI